MSVQSRFEQFAMHIEAVSQQEKKWMDVDATGAALGLSPDESRKLADLLCDEGRATTMDIGGSVCIHSPRLKTSTMPGVG
jgi:hypothetical protein